MADAALDSVIQNVEQLLQENRDLVVATKNEVQYLLEELQSLKAFLKQANEKELVKKMRIAINEAEDAIDTFLTKAKLQKSKGIKKLFHCMSNLKKSREAAMRIKSIRERLRDIRRNSAYVPHSPQDGELYRRILAESNAPVVEEDDVVGFDEEANIIINRLCENSAGLSVIPIVGMLGLGKTTLAHKIYNDFRVECEFPRRIWIYVSQSYEVRELFLSIIRMFTGKTTQYHDNSKEALANEICRILENVKYLIVLDDVWTLNALNDIKIAFPNNRKGSRVLLTTRDNSVANHCKEHPHHLRFLTDSESWELLESKVFGNGKCPTHLEQLGKRIARECMGLPLATLVITGALIGKDKTRSEWEKVLQSVSEGIINRDFEITKKLVQMSYDSLSVNLKACFLYCSAFPRGFEIPAWKLVRLWIAEGFTQNQGESTLESVAEDYLKELVEKNLIMVMRRTWDDKIKTCRIHDMLYEFCRQEASEENLFQEIKLGVKQSSPRNQELATYRRFCIDFSVVEFVPRQLYGQRTRSLLYFSDKQMMIPLPEVATISKVFPLLRVFDVESIILNSFKWQFSKLYHLKFIALSSDLITILPKSIEDLCSLQTLIVVTKQETLDIQADIWNMPHLRHFHTNSSAKLHSPASQKASKLISKQCTLQTLSTIEPESITEHVFARSQNLKKLGIRGKIEVLKTDGANPSFNINKLNCLEELKIINNECVTGGKLQLSPYIFPMSLRKLSLSGTRFDWNDMDVLSQLKVLEVLKLKDNAFMGNIWKPVGCFGCLKVLWIEKTDLISWKASINNFPSLKKLVLKGCVMLEKVPIELAKICSLQVMQLENTTKTAAECAREIKSCSECVGFKLSIDPPHL